MKIEGKNAIYEALEASVKLNKVLILNTNKDEFTSKIVNLLNKNNTPFDLVTRQILDKESKTGHHQGFIGIMDDYKYAEVSDILNSATVKK